MDNNTNTNNDNNHSKRSNNDNQPEIFSKELALKSSKYIFFGPNVEKSYGNLIINTKNEFKDVKNNQLPSPLKSEKRGFITSEFIVSKDNNVLLINTHFGLGDQEKIDQFKYIASYINSVENNFNSIIIIGDLNTQIISSDLNIFTDLGFINCNTKFPTFRDTIIDYIFIKGKVNCKDVDVINVNSSDHFLLRAKLVFE